MIEAPIPRQSNLMLPWQSQANGTVPPKTTSAPPKKVGFVPEDNRVYIE